jgi:hypothetical protein
VTAAKERRFVEVVVREAGQDRERVTALRPAFAHPAAVAESAVEQLEDLDVVARWGHVSVGATSASVPGDREPPR